MADEPAGAQPRGRDAMATAAGPAGEAPAVRAEQWRVNRERLRLVWLAGAVTQLCFWALDLAVVPELRWLCLGLRVGLIGLSGLAVARALRARSEGGFHAGVLAAGLLLCAPATLMTFFMGGFGASYAHYAPLALLVAAVVVAWPLREGALFLGLSLALFVAGNGLLLARGTGTFADALGATFFAATVCTYGVLSILFNERSLRGELRLRADLQRTNQELLASVQVLGEREGRLSAIGGVTSAVVHDVRNPLSAILSISQGVLEDAQEAGQAELAGDMEAVVASSRRLQRLFEQVLAFARSEGPALQPERVTAAELLAASLSDLSPPLRSQGITLELRPGQAGAAAVLADRAALRRVLEQLVRNAARAIADRRAEGDVVDGRIRVEAHPAGRRLRLRVADDGCGLAPEVKARLFRPFAAAGRSPGPGLGLAVARGLMRAQGGELSAEEAAPSGGGAVFVVELPLAP